MNPKFYPSLFFAFFLTLTPFCFADLFGDDIIFIKKTGVSGLDTNAETACGDNEFLRGDGTCQVVATEGITDTNIYTAGILNPDTNAVMIDLNMDGHSVLGAYDVNASHDFHVANTIYTAFLCDNFGVGCWDMTGDPHYLGGIDLELGQDLLMDGNIFPTNTLSSNLGSGAKRWKTLFVQNVNTETLDATGDINTLGSFYGDGSYLTGILPSQTGHAGEFLTTDGSITNWSALSTTDENVIGHILVSHIDGNKTFYVSPSTSANDLGNTLNTAVASLVNGDVIYLGVGDYNIGNNMIDLSLGGTGTVSMRGAGKYLTTIRSEFVGEVIVKIGLSGSEITDLGIVGELNDGREQYALGFIGTGQFDNALVKNVFVWANDGGIIIGTDLPVSADFFNLTSVSSKQAFVYANPVGNGGTINIYDSNLVSVKNDAKPASDGSVIVDGINVDCGTVSIYNTTITAMNGTVVTNGVYADKTVILNIFGGVIYSTGTYLNNSSGNILNITANTVYNPNSTLGTITYIDQNTVSKTLRSLPDADATTFFRGDGQWIKMSPSVGDMGAVQVSDGANGFTSTLMIYADTVNGQLFAEGGFVSGIGSYVKMGSGDLNADGNISGLNFVGNLDGNVKAMDVNTNALNVIAPADISATTPLIHIENDTGGNIYDLFKLDVNKNGFRLYHGTRPTHMAGMDITSDPKNMKSSAAYIHGPVNGRIYFDCLTAAGASGTCYSMEFTNIANFVDLPSRMLQNTSTTDTSMCSTGVACSSIGGTGTVDLAHVYQAVGYMSARGNQTTSQPAVKWKSFLADVSPYNSQAYYSAYSYDTNSPATYMTTLSHSKWLTAGVTKMTLTPDGNLSTAADINTATRFIARNQIGIDKNMTVTQGAGTCDLNFIGGILIASTC